MIYITNQTIECLFASFYEDSLLLMYPTTNTRARTKKGKNDTSARTKNGRNQKQHTPVECPNRGKRTKDVDGFMSFYVIFIMKSL